MESKKLEYCPRCKTNKVIENSYWRAIDIGAKWYCDQCDIHLDRSGYSLNTDLVDLVNLLK